MFRFLVADESVLFNHPLFIQSVIITDTNRVIIIIHKRLENLWMHIEAMSLFQQDLLTINPT